MCIVGGTGTPLQNSLNRTPPYPHTLFAGWDSSFATNHCFAHSRRDLKHCVKQLAGG